MASTMVVRLRSLISRSAISRCQYSISKFRIVALLLCVWLAGCCDIRWAIDDPKGPNTYTPVVEGSPRFVLEVYAFSNFDLSHAEIGQKFISMDHTKLRPIGQNYGRSVILKASPNTVLEITSENGRTGVGRVGPLRQLKIADVCVNNEDNSYTTNGFLACRITRLVIRQAPAR